MGTYLTSARERISQETLDSRIRRAKAEKIRRFRSEHGYEFCEDCGRNDCVPIDCSHNISVQQCKNECRVELAYDVSNIRLRGRVCHRKHDNSQLMFEKYARD